jgi:hypothetical protein
MRRVATIRRAILDIGTVSSGLFLAVYLPVTGRFQPWHLPLIAGLIFGNLVAREDLGVIGAALTKLSKPTPKDDA